MRKEELKKLSSKELDQLLKAIRAEIEEKKTKSGTFTMEFDETGDPRKGGKPYVARLYVDENGKLSREFFKMNVSYGGKRINVAGTYEARPGDIIEERGGNSSWKHEDRTWYLITKEGHKITVADIEDAEEKAKTIKYLNKQITVEELTKETGK